MLGIKEGGKVEGLQAALTGAAASLIAQAVTTPVCFTFFYYFLPVDSVFFFVFASGKIVCCWCYVFWSDVEHF